MAFSFIWFCSWACHSNVIFAGLSENLYQNVQTFHGLTIVLAGGCGAMMLDRIWQKDQPLSQRPVTLEYRLDWVFRSSPICRPLWSPNWTWNLAPHEQPILELNSPYWWSGQLDWLVAPSFWLSQVRCGKMWMASLQHREDLTWLFDMLKNNFII